MKKISELVDVYDELDQELKTKYNEKQNELDFKNKCDVLNLDDLHLSIHMIDQAVLESNNCKLCQNLDECKNEKYGFCYDLFNDNGLLQEHYIKCEKLKALDYLNNITVFGKKSFDITAMKDIYRDASREAVLKYIRDIVVENNLSKKGIYLSGSFGTGKTYLMNKLVINLANLGYKCGIVYYPELLVQIKSGFHSQEDVLSKAKQMDVLVIDDLGAEMLTEWNRDEVLGTILQYRMENNLFTCFTSNYNLNELKKHLSNNKEIVKATRIIDRIEYLTIQFELIGKNYRK